MNITRAELKNRAKTVLSGRYWYFFAALAIYNLLPALVMPGMNFIFYMQNLFAPIAYILIGSVYLFSVLASIFLINPLYTAICRFILKGSTEQDISFSVIWSVLKDNYFYLVKASFMRDLFIILWSLPYAGFMGIMAATEYFAGPTLMYLLPLTLGLILGGILILYKTYSYSMVNYIVADNPETGWRDAISESKRLMHGKTFFAFKLDLSFLGWQLLGLLACGVGLYFVQPYIVATVAQFYLALTTESVINI